MACSKLRVPFACFYRNSLADILLKKAAKFSCLLLLLSLSDQIFSQVQPANETDLVHYGDVVDVDVVGSLEFDWRGKLNPEGYLDGFNGFGEPVLGLCRSESEIAEAAAAALSKT